MNSKILSTVLAAILAGQSVVALAQPVPSSTAERAQGVTQQEQVTLLNEILVTADAQYGQIMALDEALQQGHEKVALADGEAAKWVILADKNAYWVNRADHAYGKGLPWFLALSAIPRVPRALQGAKGVNMAIDTAKTFIKPAKIAFVLGATIFVVGYVTGIVFDVKSGEAKSRVEFAEADLTSIQAKIRDAKEEYNSKVENIRAIASQITNKITETNSNVTISGLNFPQLRYLNTNGQSVLQLQKFTSNDGN